MAQNPTLNILANEAHALIRDEVRASAQRAKLERACADAMRLHGVSIDEVSAATGLTPDELRRVLRDTPILSGDLAALVGA